MENMLENQTDQREVYILISLPFITLLPPQGFGPEAKTRGGIIETPA